MAFLNDLNNKYGKKQIFAFVIIAYSIISILIVLIVLVFFTYDDQKIIINNELKTIDNNNISRDDYTVIRKNLRLLSTNTYKHNPDEEIIASVRESTYSESGNTISFIMDVESLKSTYAVWLSHGAKNAEEVELSCVSNKVSKYPDEFCIGSDGQSTIDADLEGYLPLKEFYSSGRPKYVVTHQAYTTKLEAKVYVKCDDEEGRTNIENEIKAWITQKGVNAEKVPIEYDKNACLDYEDDDAHGGHG